MVGTNNSKFVWESSNRRKPTQPEEGKFADKGLLAV
jgi:hypothetical protein